MSEYEIRTDEVLETLAPLAEAAALKHEGDREFCRDDPEFVEARWWASESRGKRTAVADAMMKARRMDRDGTIDGWAFVEWLWREHKFSNESRSEATGRAERYWRGYHRSNGSCLEAARDLAGIEYDDPDPIMGRLG